MSLHSIGESSMGMLNVGPLPSSLFLQVLPCMRSTSVRCLVYAAVRSTMSTTESGTGTCTGRMLSDAHSAKICILWLRLAASAATLPRPNSCRMVRISWRPTNEGSFMTSSCTTRMRGHLTLCMRMSSAAAYPSAWIHTFVVLVSSTLCGPCPRLR